MPIPDNPNSENPRHRANPDEWSSWPYSTDPNITKNTNEKLYCGIHRSGWYGHCPTCLQVQIRDDLSRLVEIFDGL